MARLSASELRYLTEIDHHDHEALVAVDGETGDGVGVARYVRSAEDGESAEAAVAVVDDWQGRGLGHLLLERLVERAREEGVRRFTALVQAENRPAIALLERFGRTRRSVASGEMVLEIDLGPAGTAPELGGALRAAAAGLLVPARASVHRFAERARDVYLGRTSPWEGVERKTSSIVVGTDGSETATEAVRLASQLADALGAALHVVSAHRPLPERRLRRERQDLPRDLDWAVHPRQDVEALLRETAESLGAGGREVRTYAREGDPAEALLDVAEEQSAQLIVVGSKGMTGAARFLLGSVPDKVSHHALCNVLIVRTT